MDHAAIMNGCDAKAKRVGLAPLIDAERVVVLVSRANFEIELGGLSGFFYNSAGDRAAETVAALEAVGATRSAAALRATNALFPNSNPPTDREERYVSWQKLTDANSLGHLDRAFGEENPDVFSRLCSFIESHREQLSEHA